MDKGISPAPVRKSVSVAASRELAFKVFTAGMGGWWIKSHSLTASGQADVIIEPRQGGRWYERGLDGEEREWGTVLQWEPPSRILLRWGLDGDWMYRADFHTEVEVRFTADGAGRTRVDLEHRRLNAYGAKAEPARASLDGENGWGALLAAFATKAAA